MTERRDDIEEDDDALFERHRARAERLLRPPYRRIVYIVPCGAKKVDKPTKARNLYTGGMFKQALRAAEAQGDGDVLILSAKYGLLSPDVVLDPYDLKMGDEGSVTVDDLTEDIWKFSLDDDRVDVYSMLPSAYEKVLDKALRRYGKYVTPLYEGTRGIGEHRKVCRIMTETGDCVKSAVSAIEGARRLLST